MNGPVDRHQPAPRASSRRVAILVATLSLVGIGLWLGGPGDAAHAPHTGEPPKSAEEIEAALPPVLALHATSVRSDPSSAAVARAIQAADAVGSARWLAPLAARLDAQLVAPEHAPVVWLAIGRAKEASGQDPEALVAWERVEAGHWAHPLARIARGRALARLGELDGAREQFQAVREDDGPLGQAATLLLADAFLSDGRPDQALWTWRKAGLPSATHDALRVKAKRVSTRRHAATWQPVLAHIERLLAEADPYAALRAEQRLPAPLRLRLAAVPELVELEAERRALDAIPDHGVEEQLAAARADHERAAIHATRAALESLQHEVRKALP